MALIIFLTGKKNEIVVANASIVILTFHIENVMHGFVLTKTETVLVHATDIFCITYLLVLKL